MLSCWKPSGPMSIHHSRKLGCHSSSARRSLRSLERLTLLGIFSNETVDIGSSLLGHSSLVIRHWSFVIRHSSFVLGLCAFAPLREVTFSTVRTRIHRANDE